MATTNALDALDALIRDRIGDSQVVALLTLDGLIELGEAVHGNGTPGHIEMINDARHRYPRIFAAIDKLVGPSPPTAVQAALAAGPPGVCCGNLSAADPECGGWRWRCEHRPGHPDKHGAVSLAAGPIHWGPPSE